MFNVVTIKPGQNVSGHYLDDPILVTFNEMIESSYLKSQYIQLYEVDKTKTKFGSNIGLLFSYKDDDEKTIKLRPMLALQPNQDYCFIINGNVKSISNTVLNSMVTSFFKTGDKLNPIHEDPIPPHVWDDELIDEDLEIQESSGILVGISESTPHNEQLAIPNLDNIIIKFDKTITVDKPQNIKIRMSQLPVEMDPFSSDKNISFTITELDVNTLEFVILPADKDRLSDLTNKEIQLEIPAGTIYTIDTLGLRHYNQEIILQYMGRLTPLYATPEQVKNAISGFGDFNLNVSDYRLYKEILKQSMFLKEVWKVNDGDYSSLFSLNRAIICLILRDILMSGSLMTGGIKSRSLLMTRVEYHKPEVKDALKAIEDCIEQNIPLGSGVSMVMSGIKSGNKMCRPTKIYKSSRR